MHDIVGPKIVFCNKYTLIMYPKTAFTKAKDRDTSLDEDSLEDEVSDIEEGLRVLDL